MEQRFFHKIEPSISITLPNGSPWKKWTVIDHGNGVIAPQSDYLSDALRECARKGIGGVTEISKADYDEWLKKKLTTLPRRWRDEWQPKAGLAAEPAQSQSTPSPSDNAPVVVDNNLRPSAEE